MKHAKILGLAAMALAALMAMAGTASATTLTAPANSTYTSTIGATSTNAILTGPFGFGTISCTDSKVKGTVATHGSGVTVAGGISELTFTTCSGGEVTSPVGVAAGSGARGSLEVHNISGTKNGTVTSLNAEVIVHKTLLGTCNFITGAGVDLGTLTGSDTGNAILDINASIPSKQCGTGKWEGTYTVTTPNTLTVDA